MTHQRQTRETTACGQPSQGLRTTSSPARVSCEACQCYLTGAPRMLRTYPGQRPDGTTVRVTIPESEVR